MLKACVFAASFSIVLATQLAFAADAVHKGGVHQDVESLRILRKQAPKVAPVTQGKVPEAAAKSGSIDLDSQFAAPAATPSPASSSNGASTVWKPGKILTGSLGQTALAPTCLLDVAAQQAAQYPDSPEAAFIYAIALTKTTQVEKALSEVRRARSLVQATNDPNYFKRAVGEYEKTLEAYPKDDCVRYGLAWAYYMQGYLIGEQARRDQRMQQYLSGQLPKKKNKTASYFLKGADILASSLLGTRPAASSVPHIPTALEGVPESAVPQIRAYGAKCLVKMDELVKNNPNDIWFKVYRAHLKEEFGGDPQAALNELTVLKKQAPSNPAAVFFLADANSRAGMFKEGMSNFSKAVQLRNQGH